MTLAFSTSFDDAFVAPKRFFLYSFSIIIFVYWLFLRIRYGWKFSIPASFPALLVYLSAVCLSLYFSMSRIGGLNSVTGLLCCILLFMVIFTSFTRDEASKAVPFLMLAGGLTALYSFLQHIGWDPVTWAQFDLVKSRWISTFGNPDFLSGFLVMIIPVVLCHAFREKFTNTLSLILFAFLCLVNILTYSRTGLASMAAGTLIALIFLGSKTLKNQKIKTAVLALMLIISVLSVFLFESLGFSSQSLHQRLNAFTNPRENNVETRLYLWQAGGKVFLSHPLLGTGPDTSKISYLPYRCLEPARIRTRTSRPESFHNMFIDIAASSGIFAILAYLIFSGMLIFGCLKFLKSREPGDDRTMAAGFMAGLFAYWIHNLQSIPPTLPMSSSGFSQVFAASFSWKGPHMRNCQFQGRNRRVDCFYCCLCARWCRYIRNIQYHICKLFLQQGN